MTTSPTSDQIPNLPVEYVPYPTLDFCGNTMLTVQVPISMSGAIPLLIGRAVAPLIWVTGPLVRNPNAGPVGWIDIVKANKSEHPMISVIHPAPNRTIVSLKDNILVDCETTGPETAMVRSLDLRPIGLVIFGNMTNLTIGMQRFYKNTFQNSTIAFAHKPQPRTT